MAGDIRTTLIGNITADPELRFAPSGDAVADFTVAVNPRRYDSTKQEWVDGETTFMRVTAWRQLAENIAESISKGDRVIVYGTLQARSWEDEEKGTRTVIEMTAENVGAELTWVTTTATKVEKKSAASTPAKKATPKRPTARRN